MVQQWTCDVDWSGQQWTCDVMMACVELQVTIMIVMMMVMMLLACVDIHTYIHTRISTWIAVVTARRSLKIIRPRPAIMAASWSSL